MKLKITMELEIGDLTDEQRAELEDGLNFRAVDDTEVAPDLPTVPTLAEQSPEDITRVLWEHLSTFGDDPDMQEEIWAGTDVYARITKVSNVQVEMIQETFDRGGGRNENNEGDTIEGIPVPDDGCAAGLHSWVDDPTVSDPDATCTRCGETYGDPE